MVYGASVLILGGSDKISGSGVPEHVSFGQGLLFELQLLLQAALSVEVGFTAAGSPVINHSSMVSVAGKERAVNTTARALTIEELKRGEFPNETKRR